MPSVLFAFHAKLSPDEAVKTGSKQRCETPSPLFIILLMVLRPLEELSFINNITLESFPDLNKFLQPGSLVCSVLHKNVIVKWLWSQTDLGSNPTSAVISPGSFSKSVFSKSHFSPQPVSRAWFKKAKL